MKILIFNWRDITHPLAGGAEIHIHEMAKRWVQWGHDVTLLVGSYRGCTKYDCIDRVNIIRTGGKYSVYLSSFLYFAKNQRNEHFDVILECINSIPFFTPIYSNKPIVALIFQLGKEVYFLEQPFLLATFEYSLETLIPKFYSKVPIITIGENSKNELLEVGFPEASVSVIYPGIHRSFCEIVSKAPSYKRPNHRILYVGRLKRYKGLAHLILAMKHVCEHIPDAELLIAGKGDFEKEIRSMLEKLDLSDKVRLCGFVSEEEKANLMKSSSVFVYPSRREGGWSISCVEALYCGVPIIVSDGLTDVVVPGETGFIVPFGHSDLIATRIIELFKNRNLWRKMSKNGNKWAQQFVWDETARQTLEVLKRTARSR